MNKYTITYDTNDEVYKRFSIEAMTETDALDAFYYEVETEETVVWKYIEKDEA